MIKPSSDTKEPVHPPTRTNASTRPTWPGVKISVRSISSPAFFKSTRFRSLNGYIPSSRLVKELLQNPAMTRKSIARVFLLKSLINAIILLNILYLPKLRTFGTSDDYDQKGDTSY